MNSTFLKVLPVAAALLLAVSCGEDAQDDSGVVVNPEPETANVVNTIPTAPDNLTPATPVDDEEGEPFTLKVIADNSLSKIAYTDDGATVNMQFDESDLGCEMSVYDDSKTHSTTMTLQSIDASGNGIFNGNWGKNGAPAEGTKLTAVINYIKDEEHESMSSSISITDLMARCRHNYYGTFNYITNNSVTLYDNLAYIEFKLADSQKQVYVNGSWYNLGLDNHMAWVAVDASNPVKTRIKGSKTLIPGYIYTLSFPDYVDLGQTVDGKVILWKTENETKSKYASNVGFDRFEFEGNYHTIFHYDIAKLFGTSIDATTDRLPTLGEYDALDELFQSYDNTEGHRGVWFGNDYGSLFLPACGTGGYKCENIPNVGWIESDEYTSNPYDDRGKTGYYWIIDDDPMHDAHVTFTVSLGKAGRMVLSLKRPSSQDGGGEGGGNNSNYYYIPYCSVRLVRGLSN